MVMSIAKITSKGQITLPKDIRAKLHLDTGEKVDFQVDEEQGVALLVPLNKHIDDVFGILKRENRKQSISIDDMDTSVQQQFRKEFK